MTLFIALGAEAREAVFGNCAETAGRTYGVHAISSAAVSRTRGRWDQVTVGDARFLR
jgi:hypothetical protein